MNTGLLRGILSAPIVPFYGGSPRQVSPLVRQIPRSLHEWISNHERCFSSEECKAYLEPQEAVFFSDSSLKAIDLSFKKDEMFWEEILKSEKAQSVLNGRLEDCEEVKEVTEEIVEQLLGNNVEEWEGPFHVLYIVCCIMGEKTHLLVTNGQSKQLKDLIFAWVLPELMVAVKADDGRGNDYFSSFKQMFLENAYSVRVGRKALPNKDLIDSFTSLGKCLEGLPLAQKQ